MIGFIIILSACSGSSTQEKIYEHLEEAVALENSFEELQNQIADLEKQEQDIYNEISDLEMSEFDKIKDLAQKAIEIIEERSDKIKQEKESIDASKEEFEKTDDLIEELEEDEVKEKAKEMYDVMIDRYETYDTLHDAYLQSLQEEHDMYLLFQEEEIKEDDLDEQISKINHLYEEVLDGNEQFNSYTVTYNELKKEFYDLANIQVKYEED